MESLSSSRSSPVWPSARSRVVGVIGDPIDHSLSPMLHNAAFDAMGIDWVSVAFRVELDECQAAIAGMRALGIAGMSVTMPLKSKVAELVDVITPTADRLKSVNCLMLQDSSVVGDSTDGAGFIDSLAKVGVGSLGGMRCAVYGTGGAARAVAYALAQEGAADIAIIGRSPDAVETAVQIIGAPARKGIKDDITDSDLVIQATPVGMDGVGGMPFDPDLLRSGQFLVDLLYHPRETELMIAASARGVRAMNGMGMLVHQAAHQISRWCGTIAPVDAMWETTVGHQ